MKINHLALATMLLAVVFVSPSFSSPIRLSNGNDLLDVCATFLEVNKESGNTSDEDYFKSTLCLGFVAGASLTIQGYHKLGIESFVCISPGVTNKQIVRVLVKYLEDNPEILDINAGNIAIEAIYSAFPCVTTNQHDTK